MKAETETKVEYTDTNGNGIPDAFENRKSISEILRDGMDVEGFLTEIDSDTLIVEIEKGVRSPKRGELFLTGNTIRRADFDFDKLESATYKAWIIRRVIMGKVD